MFLDTLKLLVCHESFSWPFSLHRSYSRIYVTVNNSLSWCTFYACAESSWFLFMAFQTFWKITKFLQAQRKLSVALAVVISSECTLYYSWSFGRDQRHSKVLRKSLEEHPNQYGWGVSFWAGGPHYLSSSFSQMQADLYGSTNMIQLPVTYVIRL